MADSSSVQVAPAAAVHTSASEFENATYRKVTRRLIPFLVLCYVVSYLDRINVGFAKLQMLSDLGFSETVFGFGAGIFFIGYFFFEVPSNIIMHRVGARVWIARIMVTWGLVSAATLLVKTPFQFYGVRFLLGLAEAGFFPGIILYLTYWYPAHRRARMVATFMLAIPLSGIIGGPISGFIMQYLAGNSGWPGWKWLFLLEALPALLIGVATIFYLDSGIRRAKWLTEDEKELLERNIAAESREKTEHPSVLAVFLDRRVWLMCWIFFACAMGQYALTFWMPTLIKTAGIKSILNVGLVTAIPYLATAATMVLVGASADRHRERRWHLAVPMVIGAAGLILSVLAGTHTALAVFFLSVAAAGVITSAPLFWSLPTAFLSGAAAAAGIAAINSVGNLAGFVSPYMVGWLKDMTRSDKDAMLCLTLILVIGAATVFMVPAKMVNR
ncbi:MAG TPA: MFS transporter [Candidatus Acidoferrales bacterium]|jgi:MFS family permease|nr:MFS transporter [Candidatus Acidoferrales bacterium]